MSSLQASGICSGLHHDRNDARRIRALERTVGELRERIRELEAVLTPAFELPSEWNLRRREAQTFRALLAADVVPLERLALALFAGAEGDVRPESAQTYVSKMKAKLSPFGVVVTSRRNEGYSLQDRLGWRAKLG